MIHSNETCSKYPLFSLNGFWRFLADPFREKMVHHPKTKKFFCKFCKKHTTCKVTQASRGEERHCALGRRRYDRKQLGFKGRVKPILRRSKKTSKKISLRFTCQSCKKATTSCLGRLRKFEWTVEKKKKHAEPTW